MIINIILIIVILLICSMVGIVSYLFGERKGWKDGIKHYKEYLQDIKDIDSN